MDNWKNNFKKDIIEHIRHGDFHITKIIDMEFFIDINRSNFTTICKIETPQSVLVKTPFRDDFMLSAEDSKNFYDKYFKYAELKRLEKKIEKLERELKEQYLRRDSSELWVIIGFIALVVAYIMYQIRDLV